ncbi:MAG: protein kinase [Candidatus Promineifilaceae bacterium]
MVGNKLGSYEIREQIGQGGMATVYRAYQPGTDRDVAIKVIRRTHDRNREAIRRFQREARLIARLEHPFILPVYDFDGGHDPPYIVMRILDGGTLKDFLNQGSMPLDSVGNLAHQIGAALDYGHRQGIIHRDVKPSNILLDQEGNAFVTDFGIARMVVGPMTDRDITAAGAIIGTPDYMAPEQIRGEGVGGAADIYALGVVLFQMIAGGLPFEADDPASMLGMHLHAQVPSALERNPQLPYEIDAVLARALAKEPKDRFPTAVALAIATRVALGGTVTSSPTYLHPTDGDTPGTYTARPEPAGIMGERWPGEQQRNVTVLHVDATEYSAMIDELHGGEATRTALEELWKAAGVSIAEQGGMIFSQTADTILALWGVEASREDDAERAILSAITLRDVVQVQGRTLLPNLSEDEPAPLGIGINTGLALLTPKDRKGSYSVSGATTSLSKRLAQQAGGAILVTHGTYSHVRGVFDVEIHNQITMRGIRFPVQTYQILLRKQRALRMNTRGVEGIETRMVGREAELRTLQNAFLDASEDGETQIITIVGEAGLGKSRLLYEFSNWCELRPEYFWLVRGRATTEMVQRPFALLRDLLSFRFEILDSDSPAIVRQKLEAGIEQQIGEDEEMAHLIGHMAGFDFSDSRHVKSWLDDPLELTKRAARLFNQWLVRLCAVHPVVVEIEDIHYADDASLDLLTGLVSEHERVRLMLVCLARPSLYERRPAWGSGFLNHTRVELHPLDKRAGRSLALEILQKLDEIPSALLDLLVERAEGNPYYLEELVKMLISDRVIIKDREDRWRVEVDRLGHITLPTTLTGLLQVRLDSLLYPEKLTLQRAAVVGRIFSDAALRNLDKDDDFHVDDLDGTLQRLVENEYINRREYTTFEGSCEYIFGSKMLREMLLQTLPPRRIRFYYVSAAEWLIEASADRADEYGSLIADYYIQASIPEKATDWYTRAAKRAMTQGALIEARRYFDNALDSNPREDKQRRWNALLGRDELLGLLGLTEARSADDEELLTLACELDDDDRLAEAYLQRASSARTVADYHVAIQDLDAAIAIVRRTGNLRIGSLALGLKVVCQVRLGELKAAAVTAEEALVQAEALGDDEILARSLNNVAMYYSASGDLARAASIYSEQAAVCRRLGQSVGEAITLANLGYLYLSLGLYERGRVAIEQSLALADSMGLHRISAYNRLNLGLAYMQQSKMNAAVQILDQAGSAMAELGDVFGQATGSTYLGMVLEASQDTAGARQQYDAALKLISDLNMPSRTPDARAGLARCFLSLSEKAAMKLQTDAVWDHLTEQGPEGVEFPILAYLTCVKIYKALDDAEFASRALENGYQELMERAERISDLEWRQSFMRNIPEHRALLEMWEKVSH